MAHYRFGAYQFDTDERQLTRGAEKISAAGKVLDLLQVLLEAGSQLVRRETIYARLWPDTIVEERNLTVHISTLRRLLDIDGTQYIETVPRTGYRMNVPVEVLDASPDHDQIHERTHFEKDRSRRRIMLAMSAAAVVAILGGGGFWLDLQRIDATAAAQSATNAQAASSVTLAILPFGTLNIDSSEDFLGLGIADAVIAQLGGLPRLGIRPTSSVMSFAGHGDPVAAGKALQVDHVLDGLIQRMGDQYRVSIQLVDVATGLTAWGAAFEEPAERLFALQDAVAERVASALVPQIAASEQAALQSYRPRSAEAYALQLRARVNLSRAEREPTFKSVEQFQQAVGLDPGYALAYSGLASAYAFLTHTNISRAIQVDDGIALARAAAERALVINADESEAYAVLAWLKFAYEWDWPGADRNFRRAVELNPHLAQTLESYGWFLSAMGRHTEALEMLARARDSDPLNRATIEYLGFARYVAGDPEGGLETLAEASALDPLARRPYFRRMLILDHLGRHDEAMAERVRWLELFESRSLADIILQIQTEQGFPAALAKWIAFLDKFDQWYEMADQWMAIGERDKALDALETCIANRCTPAPFILQHPPFKPLHDEPRFQALVREMKLDGALRSL